MFYNRAAIRQFSRLLDDFRPDVVHIHGIHRQISPSILGAARRRRIPVVQTLHDFHHVCPNDVLLCAGSEPCEPRLCGRIWYGSAVANRCVRGSLIASALSAAETGYARISGAYEQAVTRFISPSRFVATTMRQAGWELPIDIVPNAVPVTEPRTGAGDGFSVIGRLRGEKGVEQALEAARRLGLSLTVAGDGPLGEQLRTRYPEAEFVGHVGAEAVSAIIRRSRAVLVPSLWFENASMSILETMAHGVPIIASSIGGIPEQITDGIDGLLVTPGDVDGLARSISALESDPARAVELGEAARATVRARFSPARHNAALLESYTRAVGGE